MFGLEFFFKSRFPHWAGFKRRTGEVVMCSNCGYELPLDPLTDGIRAVSVSDFCSLPDKAVVGVYLPKKCQVCGKRMYNGGKMYAVDTETEKAKHGRAPRHKRDIEQNVESF